ncbi:hypothetical protein [Streptomyces azureus]|uniref:Integral membrane protein n=1 Tax=Streptomyces azureus TaxID=146537 RepID=A0A0K8PTI9_STRAJ|nr:hypothetical protein [Streptomyces azureus]GAP50764.1 uncharacterized protein SAZU_5623 [Streptomyces azureus]
MGIVVGVGFITLAGYMVRSAVMVWRDPHRARAQADGWNRLGRRGAWAVTRGIVPVAAMFTCLALMMISALGADTWSTVRGPLETTGTVFFILMLACWVVIASIAVFNRPRFLVPPYLRDRRRL